MTALILIFAFILLICLFRLCVEVRVEKMEPKDPAMRAYLTMTSPKKPKLKELD